MTLPHEEPNSSLHEDRCSKALDQPPILTVDQWLCRRSWEESASRPLPSRQGSDQEKTTSCRLPLLLVSLESLFDSSSSCEDSLFDGVVHIPFHELRQRSFELPPRDVPFVVLVEPRNHHQTLDFLLNVKANPTRTERQKGCAATVSTPWKVHGVILDDESVRKKLKVLLLSHGELCRSANACVPSCRCTTTQPRLWQPDSMIQHQLLPLLRRELSCNNSQNSINEIWDLGAGVGRDVAFLAQALWKPTTCPVHGEWNDTARYNNNFRIVGIDQRYRSEEQVKRCLEFWNRQGVRHMTECRNINLHDLDEFGEALRQQTAPICLYAVRFFHAPLMEWIARESPAGTIVAISHFCKPTAFNEWNFPHPKVSHVLERDQLRVTFTEPFWHTLLDEIVSDSDFGRPLVQFICKATGSARSCNH